MASESTMELPECPVCLQQYDAVSTIPRVLSCGHSACQDCLSQLHNPFPCTIRCPSCTQLVKLPNPISCLPKNIDLLRFSNTSKSVSKSTQRHVNKDHIFIRPPFLSHEFYSTWKTWVLPEDTITITIKGSSMYKASCVNAASGKGPDPKGCEDSVIIKGSPTHRASCLHAGSGEGEGPHPKECEDSIIIQDNNGFSSAVCFGKVVKVSNSVSTMGCVLKGNQKVSLLEIGYFADFDKASSSKFECSYEMKIMSVLYRLSDGERNELESIIKSSLGLHVLGKVYGFWYNMDTHCVYMVSEAFSGSLRNAVIEKNNEEKVSDIAGIVILGLDVCRAVSVLHLRGLVLGCLGLSCFGFDESGRVYVDISEVLAKGRRVCKTFREVVVGKKGTCGDDLVVTLKNNIAEDCVFVSPEVLFELLKLDSIVVDSGSSRHCVGYGSDIWSLACVIISLLVGKPFTEEMQNYLSYMGTAERDEGVECVRWYTEWRQKIINLVECRMGSEFSNMKEILFKCLDYNPENRPLVSELRKLLSILVVKSEFNEVINLKQELKRENMCNCLILGHICQSINKIRDQSPRCAGDTSVMENVNQQEADGVGKSSAVKDVVEVLSSGQVKCVDLKGHLNCITGLAIGGGFLFSSSFDKMVNVWSLQDYSHVHAFKGHEQRVMALAFVDYGEPLCISGDNGGAICIWRASTPLSPEPLKKLQEQQDWRYSGIHALAVSGNQYLYTGSGDKSVKAWSLQDYSLSCTMNGHKSVVSSLAICDEVLYSGSWDGTVRLWCLSDHSPLAILGEEAPGSVCSVFCVAADEHVLVAAHENGLTKIWFDDILVQSAQEHNGAIFSACKEEKWIFTGGWDKTIKVKELCRDDAQTDAIPIGSITCDSVVTALLYWEGKLFAGQADSVIKPLQGTDCTKYQDPSERTLHLQP